MNRLRSRGWDRPGPLGIGVDTDLAGKVIGTSGRPADWLWAIGSLRQGQLFESTAVPEIRLQAQDVAAQLRGRLRSVSPGYALLEGRASRRQLLMVQQTVDNVLVLGHRHQAFLQELFDSARRRQPHLQF